MNLAQWLHRTAQGKPDARALFRGTEAIADYSLFEAWAASFAGALKARGVAPGDRVGLFMANTPDYLVAFWGTWIAGAAVIPINAKLHAREAAWILDNAGASLVIATPDLAPELSGATDVPMVETGSAAWQAMLDHDRLPIVHREDGDLAWLFYTSGTTGRPKGVRMTHGMLRDMTLAYMADVDTVTGADATIYAAPMSHAAGIYNMLFVMKGARHVCPVSAGFDPDEILALSDHYGSVSMFMAPTMVRRFTDVAKARDHRADGIRTVVYAGGPMYNADIIEAVDWFGPKFVQIYGQGECPMAITALTREDVADRDHPRWRERLGSVGRAQSIVEVQIGDDDGQPLPPGEVGEIMVRGSAVMPGYWENPEATAKTLKDGWLLTGDVGRLDADGYLTLTDRSKDLIISGGSNIYPREVEEVLLEHASVHEVSCVGAPDPDWGEIVVAFVVPAPGQALDTAALDTHCRETIARFKRPKRYVEIAELPKNAYGKVLKTELRARLAGEG